MTTSQGAAVGRVKIGSDACTVCGATSGDECRGTPRSDAGNATVEPVPVLLWCPKCGLQHIDRADTKRGWANPPHRSHLCASCGCIWRPADVATVGVAEIETRGKDDNFPLDEHQTVQKARPA